MRRSPLTAAVDWMYVAWVRLSVWNDSFRKDNSPAGAAKALLISVAIVMAMLVVFGDGTRLWTKELGPYGTVQVQNRFSWDRGRIVNDGYAVFPYEYRHTGLFQMRNPGLYEGMAIGVWSSPRREEVWNALASLAASRVGSLSWHKEAVCTIGVGEGTAALELAWAPVMAVLCEHPERRITAIWYGPREYGTVADQVRLVTAVIESYQPSP